MAELILADHHEQVYDVWKERQMRDLKVAHVDFHCDMRSIVVDRKADKAFFVSNREASFIDRGNFLGHAIMEGIVTDIQWVHDPIGGRVYDPGPVVRYESDLFAPLYRFAKNRAKRADVPLQFRELLLSEWPGLRPGEQLDLDWDGLASVEYEPSHQEKLIEAFLAKDFHHTPELSFLIYSPGYSNPDRSVYEAFAERLADKLGASIARLPHQELNTEGQRFAALRQMMPSSVKALKKQVTNNLRRLDAAQDISFYKDAA